MQESSALVALVQAPLGALIEDFGTHRVVLARLPIRDELLILLHDSYPSRVNSAELLASTRRRTASSVQRVLRQMWASKLVEGDATAGYQLTQLGLDAAVEVLAKATPGTV